MQHTVLPPSKSIAKQIGTRHYFTGIPCKKGHISLRLTSCGACVQCNKERDQNQDPEVRRQKSRESYQRNAEKRRESSRRFHQENRERILEEMRERNKRYYQNNKERIKKQVKEYTEKNAEWRKEYIANWTKDKLDNCPKYKAMYAARKMLHRILGVAGQKKTKRTQEALGYTYDELREHLERQFTKGMTWDNYGKWHIDHIRPVKAFVDEGVTDPAIINALPNLRPVWADENMSKGSKELFLL